MSTLQVVRAPRDPARFGLALISEPSIGVSPTSALIQQRLKSITAPTPTFIGSPALPPKSLEEKLYDALAAFKIRTATVAMHLDRDWRSRLFHQLDSLLAVEDWDVQDPPPSLASFSTFLRMLILLRPDRRPGLGATDDGNLIAAWTVAGDRLTIECLKEDIVRWNLAATFAGEREKAAAITPLPRLADVLAPYDPARWFRYADHLSA